MTVTDIMYDETEVTATRFVGFTGEYGRFDLAIVTTNHFFGKRFVISIQSGRSAILTAEEAEDADYIASAFQVSEQDAAELATFLASNL